MELKLEEQWAELLTVLFIVIGFILGIGLKNTPLSYLSIILSGFLAGRIYYQKYSAEPILPFILIIVGFLLGFLIGAVWINRLAALVLFGVFFGISYYFHMKQILVIFKSKNFLK